MNHILSSGNTIYVGITDDEWLGFIKTKYEDNTLNEYLNFWTPGTKEFRALIPGDVFLFKHHNNARMKGNGEIVGGAFFCGFEKMGISEAWKQFGNGNGTESLLDLKNRIIGYKDRYSIENNLEIGCIVLNNPFFFDEPIAEPNDWSSSIVRGKKYDASSPNGSFLTQKINEAISLQRSKTNLIKKIDSEIDTLSLVGEECLAHIKVRVNQSKFRARLLEKHRKCCLCNVEHPILLRASHIKPWAASTPTEKLDIENGLLLCPNHDALFDSGLISFDDHGRIMISDRLSQTDKIFMNVNPNMRIALTTRNTVYMAYHRQNIFK